MHSNLAVNKECDVMSIYEISHVYDPNYFREERNVVMVGNKKGVGVINESEFQDNISYKNPNYCELTAIYALYRNTKDDFYGIEHYRRYFCGKYGGAITEKECRAILKSKKIILPVPCTMLPNNFVNYSMFHYVNDMEAVRDIIFNYEHDYSEAFDCVMGNDKLSCYNMMICDAKTFQSYCEWLFRILEKCEETLRIDSYSTYQARIFGFLSERLLNVWVHKNIPAAQREYRTVQQTDKRIQSDVEVWLRTVRANVEKIFFD